uniref:Glucuronosyltransferase n=1 Tax=Heterorhabditis bacteriophora TaxID=37862 RepID=A0A1I7XFX1_HETBA
MNRKKETAASRLVEAVEYSAIFGKIHDIDVAGYDLYAFQYFSLDVICAWLLVISFVIYSICTVFLLFCRSRKRIKLQHFLALQM